MKWISTYLLQLVFVEVRNFVHDYERESSSEVDKLVHGEGHDTSSKDIVLHVGIPCCPHLLENPKVDIVHGDIIVVIGVGDWQSSRKGC